jgi:hypothetical protein
MNILTLEATALPYLWFSTVRNNNMVDTQAYGVGENIAELILRSCNFVW